MKRKILLLTQKTLAQEVNLTADGYGEGTISKDIDRKGVEIESETENFITEGALNFGVSNSDNVPNFEQAESVDTELEIGVQVDSPSEFVSENIAADIEIESQSYTLNAEIGQTEDSPDEKNVLATVALQTTTNLVNGDEFKRENGLELDDVNATKLAKGIEVKDNTVTVELTILDTSETTTEAVSNSLNNTDEVKVTESSSDVTLTEEPQTEIASDHTTETPEESVTKNDNTTTEAPRIPTQKLCATLGTFAAENDCRSYFTCTPSAIGELQIQPKNCPNGQAFDRTLLRCSRDLSPCTGIFYCNAEGTFAASTDNSSYYWCVASRLSNGLRVYHVKCGNGQIFTPELGKCFVDMTSLHDLSLNYDLYLSKSPDEECVREEVKIMKAEEKVKLKEAKLREKIQRKYEKELLKKAEKEAKEQAKLQGISLEEQVNFNCTQVGSFAAAAENFYDYIVCLSKKGDYKAVGMKCADSQSFSAAKGFCTLYH
ncbi:uncharacterized protein LOC118753479 [Rhagoletis pomonella]|uniref:uncharacterized protein LOC118753479 n=1 Tax=Rhagoletis pomonella TaxID=28610 RepID=UPI00177D5523|nr:uncharacterized protein LOC118753479 [Rhagoletis pomonella]